MNIKSTLSLLFLAFGYSSVHAQTDSLMMRKIYNQELTGGYAYDNLHYLCKNIGPRLSGSANAQKAVDWSKKLMESYGFDHVYLQEVMVPHWVRGEKEKGLIIDGKTSIPVALAALGGSVGTPKQGITAEVIELQSLKELETLGEAKIKGKIVFFNRPFDDRFIEGIPAYMGAADQRFFGPEAAAKFGAVGVIIRSLTFSLDNYPHTGFIKSTSSSSSIPAAALSTLAANKLSELIKKSKSPVKFYLKQNCEKLPDAVSYNVIGELKGAEYPNQYITVGGHLDSWDLAEGAHDDGTGVMQAVEVPRILKELGYHPKHTIRVVLFMAEETGGQGADKYAELAAKNKEEHIAAIESDEGGYTPRGFRFGVSESAIQQINTNWKNLFIPYNSESLIIGGNNVDIASLKRTVPGVVLIDFRPDSQRYFSIHHSSNDVFENVNKRELELGAASMASLTYLIDQHGI